MNAVYPRGSRLRPPRAGRREGVEEEGEPALEEVALGVGEELPE
jgi:hypothetical protein